MASIKKRKNSYQITVSNGYDVSGKKIIETATYTPEPGMSKKEIEIAVNGFALDFERSVKSGKNIRSERSTLADLAAAYKKDMQPPVLARSTYKDYCDRIDNRIIPAMGHIKIGNIRQKDLNNYKKMLRENYRVERSGKPLSEASIRKDGAVISALLSYAVSEGYLDINPIIYAGKTAKNRSSAAQNKQVRYFTVEQLMRFIDALERPIEVIHQEHTSTVRGKSYKVQQYTQTFSLDNKWKLYFYIALFIGDRRGENISLTWNDINMDTREVYIDKSTDYVDGEMRLKDTKTHEGRQNILPQYVIDIARSWKKEQMVSSLRMGEDWKGYHGNDFDKNYVFTQKNGSQMHICSPYTKYKRLIRLYNENVIDNEQDKIPEDVPPHGLRHSAAAIMIANNLDARTVAGILGHKNPTTTLNIYSYFFKSKGDEASDIMANVLIPEKLKSVAK